MLFGSGATTDQMISEHYMDVIRNIEEQIRAMKELSPRIMIRRSRPLIKASTEKRVGKENVHFS